MIQFIKPSLVSLVPSLLSHHARRRNCDSFLISLSQRTLEVFETASFITFVDTVGASAKWKIYRALFRGRRWERRDRKSRWLLLRWMGYMIVLVGEWREGKSWNNLDGISHLFPAILDSRTRSCRIISRYNQRKIIPLKQFRRAYIKHKHTDNFILHK